MQSLDQNEWRQILTEVMADQLQVILEYVKEIPIIKRDVQSLQEDMREVKQRLQAHDYDIKRIYQKLDTIAL